jgi:putative RNA 2'-phosphotransferase
MKDQTIRISKTLSLWLRHKPDAGGLRLSPEGWAKTEDVLKTLQNRNLPGDPDILEMVVETNDKKRFEFSEDGLFIRASQGHSVKVDLAFEPVAPPDILFHGTVERFCRRSLRKVFGR